MIRKHLKFLNKQPNLFSYGRFNTDIVTYSKQIAHLTLYYGKFTRKYVQTN
jgi:hypothetical protein